MAEFLLFQLYGPMASWGEAAAGEVRHTASWPTRSALTGLLGAALGIELAAGDSALLTEMIGLANSLAAEHGDGDFRLVFNTGAGAGQTVFHVHAHVLSGGLEEGTLGG